MVFPAHFQDEPNVPGFIQIECLVQTFLMTFLTLKENKGIEDKFFDLNNAKFRKKIIPGDTMKITSKLDYFKRGLAKEVQLHTLRMNLLVQQILL